MRLRPSACDVPNTMALACERAALRSRIGNFGHWCNDPDMDRMGKLGIALAILRCASRYHREISILMSNIHGLTLHTSHYSGTHPG